MKLVPCRNCGAKNIGPKTAKHPSGAPVIFGYWSGGAGLMVVKCFRCGNSYKLGAAEFNGLPSLSKDEKQALGLVSPPTVAVPSVNQEQSGTTPSAEVSNA